MWGMQEWLLKGVQLSWGALITCCPSPLHFFSSRNADLLGLDVQQLLRYNKSYAPGNLEQEEGRSLPPS